MISFILKRIQTREVVAMAAMVPMGMDFCASFRFPDRLDPAIIPVGIHEESK